MIIDITTVFTNDKCLCQLFWDQNIIIQMPSTWKSNIIAKERHPNITINRKSNIAILTSVFQLLTNTNYHTYNKYLYSVSMH